jgi:recombination protein RecA
MQDEDKNVTGNAITAYTTKNRFYPAFQEAVIEIDYKNGINTYAGILNLAVEAGIVEKSGSWYSYKNEKLGQGESNAMEVLKNNSEWAAKIIDDLNVWLKTTGYSTVNENLKQAEEMALKDEDASDLDTPDEVVEEKPKKVKKNGKK